MTKWIVMALMALGALGCTVEADDVFDVDESTTSFTVDGVDYEMTDYFGWFEMSDYYEADFMDGSSSLNLAVPSLEEGTYTEAPAAIEFGIDSNDFECETVSITITSAGPPTEGTFEGSDCIDTWDEEADPQSISGSFTIIED